MPAKPDEDNRQFAAELPLFEANKNAMSQTAWAAAVYSLVPFLGIIIVPFAFIFGILGIVRSRNDEDGRGKRLAIFAMATAAIILAVQLFLWWLLYNIPESGIMM